MRVLVRFFSPSGKQLYRNDWITGRGTIVDGFGTEYKGEHLLVVEGYQTGVGTYNIKLEEMATPEEMTGEANVLEHNGVAKGYMAGNTKAVYKVFSNGNTAYRITSEKQSESMRVLVRFFSPSGKQLYRNDWFTENNVIDNFETKGEGEHLLVVEGYERGVGTYDIKLEEVE